MNNPTISSSEKSKRLPSLKRAALDDLPGFRATLRDAAIIEAVYQYRAVTAPQIAALFFGSKDGEVNSRCKFRLRMLYHRGYLFRDEQPTKLSEGRKPLVYFLDSKGAEFLTQELGLAVNWDRNDNDVSYPFLTHLLAIGEVRVAINLSARKRGWEILTWLDDKTLKSPQMKDKVMLKGEQGGKVHASVVPDSYLRLDAQQDIFNFFIEVDRGTVTGAATEWGRRDWARKIKAYLEYYQSGKYQQRYHTPDMRILTITTGEKRLANLKQITESAGGKARFWFTTFKAIRQGDILTAPIWAIASRNGLRGIIS